MRLIAHSLLALLLLRGATAVLGSERPVITPSPQSVPAGGLLRATGRFFFDPAGGVVILRGINLTGNAKLPPFQHGVGPGELDRLQQLGINVIRLLFIWEAYEPTPGFYDESYLEMIRATAALAWSRGIYTVIDIHQDGFSRFASRGSGDGFPAWAVSGHRSEPDNGPGCRYWPILMATDRATYQSFRDFYADTTGVRTRYLILLGRVASACATTPGVIGYDPINEPWGDERDDLGPLYRDAAAVIRARHPAAILFLEGHITTNSGLQTKLDRPDFGNVAYSPHYYKPSTIALQSWKGSTRAIDHAFLAMDSKAREWNTPLFVSEFGIGATVQRAGDYVEALVDRLDSVLASAAQWNYTPLWNDRDKDGWNAEDFSVLDRRGQPRPNFRLRPHPRRVAGIPLRFTLTNADELARCQAFELDWEHRPELGNTEIFVPQSRFPLESAELITSEGVQCFSDAGRQLLVLRSDRAGMAKVRVVARR